jgi:PAS domain S-box-containing protein
MEKIKEVLCSGKPSRCEDQREGSIFDTNMYSMFDTAGKVARVAIFARDITEQRQVEGALREAKRRYKALFENIPVGVGIATYGGRILACNKTMLQMLGYGAGEIEQFTLEDTYVDPTRRTELLKRVRAEGRVREFEVELKRKDGMHYEHTEPLFMPGSRIVR